MKYEITTAKLFRRQYKKAIRRGCPMEEVWGVVRFLSLGEVLDKRYKAHRLKGKGDGIFELHIRPDLLLLYEYREDPPILKLAALGTHAELFGR